MTMSQIQQESAYRNFIESLPSPISKIVYRNNLKLYARYRNAEIEKLLEGDPRLLQSQIIDYIIYLKNAGLSGNSINTRIDSIKKFYESNDIDLRWKKIKGYIGSRKKRVKKDRPYTHEEIKKILDKANERERVVILLMASSGMRIGALNTLKVKHLQSIDKYSIYKIMVYENEEDEYITFCTPECRIVIDSYLGYRRLHGERIQEDAPLIREQFDIHDEIQVAHPKHLTSHTLKKMVQQIRLRTGIVEKSASRTKKHDVMESHGFRKFFQTVSVNNGMSMLYSEMLMGHKSGGLAMESYVRPTDNDLLEGNDRMRGYSGIFDALTINEENKLRIKLETLTEKQDEIQSLKYKYEQDMKIMREEMESKFQQLLEKIDIAKLG